MNTSPYAPPQSVVADAPTATSQAEAIRRDHVRHEIQLKSVGSLYYLGAIMVVVSAVTLISALASDKNGSLPRLLGGMAAFYAVFGVVAVFLGYGFRRLKPWVKIPGTILSIIGLVGIPVGTLINGWILYLIHCKKGQTILSPGYQDIIAATPHVKYRRSVGDWIALGLILAMLLGIVGLLIFSALR